ncbi:hypothetical protein [Candidatus Nitrosotalea bavarica]|jgi:hypothetical protein|uniref:hypothetical protein n=1 Tax=Candidatus Nitrosotalea bavarica TaxID=1903277 RepID=UPI000C711BD2|nr:hypothetical protein [Candidatus Nitrosotalea bavarica]
MSNNMMLLFTMSVILTSFAIMVIPQASALNQNMGEYNKTPVTARFEGAKNVCGDHLCALGERTAWEKAVWDHQNISQGKISSTSQHGESVLHNMAGSTAGSTTMHGNTMSGNMNMGTNMAANGNMTKGTK